MFASQLLGLCVLLKADSYLAILMLMFKQPDIDEPIDWMCLHL